VTTAGSNISDVEGLLNIYATQIATLTSQLDYNPRAAGITLANAALSIHHRGPPKGRDIPGKALQGSFVEFAYSYTSRKPRSSPDDQKCRAIGIGRAYHDLFDRSRLHCGPATISRTTGCCHRIRRTPQVALRLLGADSDHRLDQSQRSAGPVPVDAGWFGSWAESVRRNPFQTQAGRSPTGTANY